MERRSAARLCACLTAMALSASCATAPAPADIVVDGKAVVTLPAGAGRTEAGILANKWAMDLITPQTYGLYGPFKLAILMDPFLHETYARLGLAQLSPVDFVRAVSVFAAKETVHLQHIDAFKDKPSRMPWGALDPFGIQNVYRRLLPSEMKAMSVYAGKVSGACECLTLFFTGLFRLKGVPPEDIVHLRLPGHTVALIRYEGAYYGVNNTIVGLVNPAIKAWHLKQDWDGLFGETFALYKGFTMKEGAFSGSGSLVEAIASSSGLVVERDTDVLAGVPPADLGRVRDRLLVELAARDAGLARQVRYASQRRDVEDFSVYINASLRGPLARELASRLHGADAAADWVRENVKDGSIFADGGERVLMADQTIVYETGTELDRSLLLYTLLAHQGGKPRLVLDGGRASVLAGGKEYP